MIKLIVLKNRLSGILSVGHPIFSFVSGILSVVDIPSVPIPIPEEIQLLMYVGRLITAMHLITKYLKFWHLSRLSQTVL